MRFRIIGTVIVAVALLGAMANVAFASGSSSSHTTSGVEHYWVSGFGPTGHPSDFVGTGLFTDAGSLSKSTVTVSKGSFQVDTSKIKSNFGFNAHTCFVEGTFGGTIRLYGGTGAYAGISGTLPIGGHVVAVIPRLSDGRCNGAKNAPSLATAGLLSGSGTVTL